MVSMDLSAWIDIHSRFLVEARYYVRENFDCLVDSLLRAWAKHGCSRELYADNGKIYHANGLTLACAKLHIRKLFEPISTPPIIAQTTARLVKRRTIATSPKAVSCAARPLNRFNHTFSNAKYDESTRRTVTCVSITVSTRSIRNGEQ